MIPRVEHCCTWVTAVLLVTSLVVCSLTVHVAAQRADVRQREEQQREQWQKVDEIFQALGVRPGAHIADVGAGWGFFTSRLSRAVGPSGRVFAVDIDEKMLALLRTRAVEEALNNVEVVRGSAGDPHVSDQSLDAALIVNAYHEMPEHQAILGQIRRALKPDGRLVIVEAISSTHRDDSRDAQTERHEIGPEFAARDVRGAGYRIIGLQDPFIRRKGSTIHWMLVLTPDPDARPTVVTSPSPPGGVAPPAATERANADNPDAWKDPALRISVKDFKRLLARNGVVVLDVRDDDSYRLGHIPGARLMLSFAKMSSKMFCVIPGNLDGSPRQTHKPRRLASNNPRCEPSRFPRF